MANMNKYCLATKSLTSIIFIVAGFTIYFLLCSPNDLDFGINWNMFDSILIFPLYIIGFIIGLGQKFDVYKSVLVTRDGAGNVTDVKPNDDIIDSMFVGCLMPILQYFLLFPLMMAAVIYYPLMGLVYLFSAIFPYLISAFIVVSIFFAYQCMNRIAVTRMRNFFIPFVAFFFIGIYWLCYTLWVSTSNPVYMKWETIICSVAAGLSVLVFIIIMYAIKDEHTETVQSKEEENDLVNYEPKISSGLVITFVVALLIMVGVYSFKLAYTTPKSSYTTPVQQITTYVANAQTSLSVRSGAGSSYNKIGSIQDGDTVQVYSIDGEWAKIYYNGKTAYVSAKYLAKQSNNQGQENTSISSNNKSKTSTVSSTNQVANISSDTSSKQCPTKVDASKNQSTNAVKSTPIYIPKTKGNISSHNENYDRFFFSKRMKEADKQLMKISNVNSAFQADDLVKGKSIYQGKEGSIKSFLYVEQDNNTQEYLVSYDASGNYISHVLIGELGVYTGTRAYAQIGGNKISVHYAYPSESGTSENSTVTYFISDKLKFVKQ